jgi:hypothetical protein
MRNIFLFIGLCFLLIDFSSCSGIDNYPAPSETLKGTVFDSINGTPLQTEVGGGGYQIELDELSWSANPTPYYFNSMQDGTYQDTKLFSGQYRISIVGAFVPLVQYDSNGNVIVDKRKIVDIKGVTTVNFNVEPFLRVEWIGEPKINADGTVTVQVKVTRGTNNPNFQQNINDVTLFVNEYQYIGNNEYDSRFTNKYNGDANAIIGDTISITTLAPPTSGETWYLRVGARISYGQNLYNYNQPVEITMP